MLYTDTVLLRWWLNFSRFVQRRWENLLAKAHRAFCTDLVFAVLTAASQHQLIKIEKEHEKMVSYELQGNT